MYLFSSDERRYLHRGVFPEARRQTVAENTDPQSSADKLTGNFRRLTRRRRLAAEMGEFPEAPSHSFPEIHFRAKLHKLLEIN